MERHVPYIGQFGWEFNKAETVLNYARIVQIGWAITSADMSDPVVVKTAMIRPSDFTISDKATKYHGITQAFATQEGRSLEHVLEEMVADAVAVRAQGGRLCAHQLETAAGLKSEHTSKGTSSVCL